MHDARLDMTYPHGSSNKVPTMAFVLEWGLENEMVLKNRNKDGREAKT